MLRRTQRHGLVAALFALAALIYAFGRRPAYGTLKPDLYGKPGEELVGTHAFRLPKHLRYHHVYYEFFLNGRMRFPSGEAYPLQPPSQCMRAVDTPTWVR